MNSTHKIGVVTATTLAVSFAAFAVTLVSVGAGHGNYLLFAILFPYSFLATAVLGGGIGIVAGTLTLAQFPVYGVILGRSWLRDDLRLRATWVIVTQSLVAAVCTIIFFTK